jgi:hypothetical protein
VKAINVAKPEYAAIGGIVVLPISGRRFGSARSHSKRCNRQRL